MNTYETLIKMANSVNGDHFIDNAHVAMALQNNQPEIIKSQISSQTAYPNELEVVLLN